MGLKSQVTYLNEINERSQGRFCQNHVKEHSSVEIEEEMTTN